MTTAPTDSETRAQALPCPTPSKACYATQEAADAAALREQLRIGVLMRPYACVCGWLHLTKRGADTMARSVTATDRQAALAARLPAEAFRELVVRELHGDATRVEGSVLRHPLVLARWRRELADIAAEARTHYADRTTTGPGPGAAVEWRYRARTFATVVTQRRAEAKRLARAAREHATGTPTVERCLRAEAGHIAVMRLIDTRYDQFAALLAEEYARLGITPPDRAASRAQRRASRPASPAAALRRTTQPNLPEGNTR